LNFPIPKDLLNSLLFEKVDSIKPISGGGNASCYQITTESGKQYFGKKYAKTGINRINRQMNEWNALRFFEINKISSVPVPIVFDQCNQLSIFEWIKGEKVSRNLCCPENIKQALIFLKEINFKKDFGRYMPTASEGVFTLRDSLQIIMARLDNLLVLEDKDSNFREMKIFLKAELIPALKIFEAKAFEQYKNIGIGPNQELDQCRRILSPSDFGFHNCLETDNGLVWLDFEYFGWDDPAKTLIDFLLHPGMNLSVKEKKLFWDGMSEFLSRDYRRVKALYPIFGIKWCIIMLNEFLSDGIKRRVESSNCVINLADKQHSQLEKAKSLLGLLFSHCEEFPYE